MERVIDPDAAPLHAGQSPTLRIGVAVGIPVSEPAGRPTPTRRIGVARSRPTRAGSRPLAALLGLALGATSLVLASPESSAAGGELRTPLPKTTSAPAVAAASGSSVVLDVSLRSRPHYVVTSDNGETFADLANPAAAEQGITDARDGVLVAWAATDDGTQADVYRTDLATNTARRSVRVASGTLDAVDPTNAVYRDGAGAYQARELGSSAVHALVYTAPADVPDLPEVGLSPGAVLFAATTRSAKGRPGTGYLDVVPTSGGAPLVVRTPVNRLVTATIRAGEVLYVTASPTRLSLCVRTLTDWANPTCRSVKAPGKTDERDAWVSLHASDDWALWSIASAKGSVDYVVGGTGTPEKPARVRPPKGATLYPVGDGTWPLATVPASIGGYVAGVDGAGSVVRLFDYPQVPVSVEVLEVTPDRVAGLDDRPDAARPARQAWQRTLTASAIGEDERPYPRASDIGTSGARTLLDDGTRLRLYDRGLAVRTLSRGSLGSLPGLLSGPYYPARALAYLQVRRVDGAALKKATIRGLFGPLVLTRTNASLGRYDVVDVETGASARVDVPATWRAQGFELGGLWGDWVYGYTVDADGVPYTLAINYRTGASHQRYGVPLDYGDGFVAFAFYPDGADDVALGVWNPATDAIEVVPDTDWDVVGTDGTGRLAYTTEDSLVVRTLTVAPATAPRLLGVVAPATLNVMPSVRSWRPEFDTTKPLGDGTLTIRDAADAVVRVLSVPASADGSLRDVAWDGRDEAGADVPVGTYSWHLAVPAADSTGSVLRADGSADPSGTLRVVREYLGSVRGAKPKVSGTARVGRTLTAKPGTWSPRTTTLGYQWLRKPPGRPAVPITDATGARYTLTADDRGARISVTVTGTLDGWKPATTTSKATASVRSG